MSVSFPTISVVMSVYNAEEYLEESIDSILNQTYSNFEFIIIDDCSTDSSFAILEEYATKDSRIKLLQKKENKGTQGFIENLNWGLEEARGKYIARMDADDISHPTRFEQQVDFLDNNPNVFIIGAQLDLINEKNEIIGEKLASTDNEEIQERMLKTIQLFHPVIMFRNEGLRYRDKVWYCEDYELYLRLMSKQKKMANLPIKLLKYRVLGGSISRKGSKFIKYMFLSKAFEMYYERQKTGKDTYEQINPYAYVNIHNIDYKNSMQEMEQAARACLKYKFREELVDLVKKQKKFYPNEKFGFYSLVSKLPPNLFNLCCRILNQI
ncbi:glycosyltransferase family 2 protein [Riemerella anatipestifer]|uniref:glycosyltransferase family 2 protein n=1 Tax=Riemerella anatipestifer TaxID=34085 RepID=UPI00137256BE|nr:glycosyltransferase family 2 protein [Riemerella anatipestifer]MBT0549990.1 glycosyltransferase [Riemerella anatipestifer]MBT0555041.1 glycosyltransferase [Riemerella anatipestifer]MBT0560779.1 glycosyltransferase [Riemerella anatipestifer]MCO7355469.1 glycosyltransferase [Riemerella anatipestifer]NAV15288.1 glycosyltransferase [Riemerella anatipestifer]